MPRAEQRLQGDAGFESHLERVVHLQTFHDHRANSNCEGLSGPHIAAWRHDCQVKALEHACSRQCCACMFVITALLGWPKWPVRVPL